MRKHILNKHGDKIEEVKKEVEFFNNFLMDAKRPALPEMKPPPPPGPGQGELFYVIFAVCFPINLNGLLLHSVHTAHYSFTTL